MTPAGRTAGEGPLDPEDFLAALEDLLSDIPEGGRRLVAIAGAPASGKTTLAAEAERRLNAAMPGSAAVLPMDGFHYDDQVLVPRGWRARKGAPHTFDVGGLAAMLARLKRNDEAAVAVPRFDRTLEIARAGAALIDRTVRLVLVEGNYLLLDEAPWDALAPVFDLTVMIRAEEAVLAERLRRRWVDHGLDAAGIAAKLDDNDLPNARLVYESSRSADLQVAT
ncbi:nucleoside/nucleotide kinase family protein [Pelagibius sp.]|uniref:nucleoside/nucleotide kinase family protein n=1 Tax=Pelagibius sp. TaxID=1931238 RepID=UPI00262114C4|nr:nucleoside/nucleotide kinase family protein [Pelagibius sp.]